MWLRRTRHRTNRWTGATGSDFRIKRDPAELLGSAVARSTQPFDGYVASMRTKTSYGLVLVLIIAGGVLCACGFVKPIFTGPRDVIVADPSRALSDARRLINEHANNPNRKPLFEPQELPESLQLPGLLYAIVHGDHLDLILGHNPDLTAGARIWSPDSKRTHRDRATKYPEIFFYQY